MLAWVVMFSIDSRRPTHCRHVTKIPSPQLLLFPGLINCDARNPFRIRSYENCRVGIHFPHSGIHPIPLTIPITVLSFHTLTKCKFRNPFVLIFIQNAPGGVPPTPPCAKPLSVCLRLFPSPLRIP